MKKGCGKIFVILIILITPLLLFLNESEKSTGLSKKDKVEEVEYLCKTIEENYPFLEVNERLTGIDWLSKKEEYIKKAKETKSDEEYLGVISNMIFELHNGHTQILRNKEEVMGLYHIYIHNNSWQRSMVDVIKDEKVMNRYGINKEDLEKGENQENTESTSKQVNVNARVKDIVSGKVGYVEVPQMIGFFEMDKDEKLLSDCFNKVKNYQALVIDIRGNSGGDSAYWMMNIVEKLASKPYSSTTYVFLKDGEVINKYKEELKKVNEDPYESIENLDTTKLPNLPPEVEEKFKYYDEFTMTINPNDSVNFKGNIYLLVDNVVYSSAEAFAVFSKDSGFATLIGKTTGGDGLGSDPILLSLPKSGYILRMSKDMGTSSDGTCNEEYKTIPDYEVTIARKKENYLADECIQKVLELENLK